jgi:hypothetical protein
MSSEFPTAPVFTYSRNKRGIIVRSDGALIPEHDPNNAAFKFYKAWEAKGGKLEAYKPAEAETKFETEQEAIRTRNVKLAEDHRHAEEELKTHQMARLK